MRRFELVDGSSSKFWEIEQSGSAVTVRFGRIGTNGQTQTKEHGDDARATREHDKLIGEKTRKGYLEVGGGTLAPVAPRTPALAAVAVAPAPPPAPVVVAPVSEDQVFPNPARTRRAFPRRGSPAARPYTLKAEALHARLVPFLDKRAPRMLPDLRTNNAHAADQLDILAARVSAPLPLAPGSPQDDALLIAYLAFDELSQYTYAGDLAIDLLLATRGPGHTVRAAIAAADLTIDRSRHLERKRSSWFIPRHLIDLRARLAAMPEADYAQGLEAGETLWTESELYRCAWLSFLFPARVDQEPQAVERRWCAALVPQLRSSGEATDVYMTLASVADAALLDPHWASSSLLGDQTGHDVVATLVDGLGLAAVPFVAAIALADLDAESAPRQADSLAMLGSDVAFAALAQDLTDRRAQKALARAVEAQPERARRILGPMASRSGKVAAQAQAHLDLLERQAAPGLPVAPPGAVPAIFGPRPKVAPARPVVIEPLPLTLPPPAVRWGTGMVEDKDWFAGRTGPHAAAYQRAFHAGTRREVWEASLAKGAWGGEFWAHVPADLVAAQDPGRLSFVNLTGADDDWLKATVANLELLAVPLLLERQDKADPQTWLDAVMPLGHPALAPAIATLAGKGKTRDTAVRWFARHLRQGVAGILAHALGQPGKARKEAETVLRLLAGEGQTQSILEVASLAGDQARAAIETLLAVVPEATVKLPELANPTRLPALELAADQGALPPEATTRLLEMLAQSTLERPHPGIAVARATLTPSSRAHFAWDLFSQWNMAGAQPRDGWILQALGHLGNDDIARKLAALIRVWPGEGGHARAVAGLEVLATIGSDVALTLLNGIAQKVKFKGLQDQAQRLILQIASARGLSPEALADRLVPDLGLGEDGATRLDFGPRQFTVGFDETLAPFVKDESGARLKDLPKPGKSDDAALAEAAVTRWKQMKKDARAVASLELGRLEQAMCMRRRFAAATFRQLFVQHPLLVHVVRRLVWATYQDDTLTATFRVSEDSSFADAHDAAWQLPEDATVGLPHPLELAEVAAAWGSLFGDYQLLQPFPQLGRPVHRLQEHERNARGLFRFEGRTTAASNLFRLESRGWRRGPVEDGGVSHVMEKSAPGEVSFELDISPGLVVGAPGMLGDQTLGSVSIRRLGRGDFLLSKLHPVVFSELVHDLETLLA